MQTHDIEVGADGQQRVLSRTPGVKQYVLHFKSSVLPVVGLNSTYVLQCVTDPNQEQQMPLIRSLCMQDQSQGHS